MSIVKKYLSIDWIVVLCITLFAAGLESAQIHDGQEVP